MIGFCVVLGLSVGGGIVLWAAMYLIATLLSLTAKTFFQKGDRYTVVGHATEPTGPIVLLGQWHFYLTALFHVRVAQGRGWRWKAWIVELPNAAIRQERYK